MKKVLSILVAAMLVMAMAVTAFADADLASTYVNHIDSGLDVATVDLPADVVEGETVTLKIKGTADANFRVYLGNGVYPSRESDIVTVEVVDGAFETEVVLVASLAEGSSKGVANNVVIKGASYGLPVPEIAWEYVTLVGADAAVEETPVVEETPAVEEPVEDTPVEETPVETKPADTGLALAVVPMIVAAAAVALSKKR